MTSFAVDPAPILGNWHCTDEDTTGLVRFELLLVEGALHMLPIAASPDGTRSLGELPAHAYAATPHDRAATALTASADEPWMRSLFTFYFKGGLAVLDAFHDCRDGRRNQYARQLFHKADPDRLRDQARRGIGDDKRTPAARYVNHAPGEPSPAGSSSAPIDLSALGGLWHNANAINPDVARLTVQPCGDEFVLRLFGAGDEVPSDWGGRPVTAYCAATDPSVPIGFCTVYDGDRFHAIVTAYGACGVLVLDCHTTFKDATRSACLFREFFHR